MPDAAVKHQEQIWRASTEVQQPHIPRWLQPILSVRRISWRMSGCDNDHQEPCQGLFPYILSTDIVIIYSTIDAGVSPFRPRLRSAQSESTDMAEYGNPKALELHHSTTDQIPYNEKLTP